MSKLVKKTILKGPSEENIERGAFFETTINLFFSSIRKNSLKGVQIACNRNDPILNQSAINTGAQKAGKLEHDKILKYLIEEQNAEIVDDKI